MAMPLSQMPRKNLQAAAYLSGITMAMMVNGK
jgi:hypothetical protein